MLYSVNSSPLVSRHLAVLREEVPTRAFSFSGQAPKTRGAPSRALSLSAGRGGGRINDGNDMPYSEPVYHRADSAPPRAFDQLLSQQHDERMDTRHEAGHDSWPGPRHRDEAADIRRDPRHDSWPQPYSSSRAMFHPPPAGLQRPPPQFHPVGPEDLAALKSYPDNDEMMVDVERSQSQQIPSHWSNTGMDVDMPSRQGTDTSHTGAHLASTQLNVFPPQCDFQPQNPGALAAHQRTSSSASATAIVAQLASAIPDTLGEDENPFEPIPIGAAPKPKNEENYEQKW
jgi:hypothetical protein